MVHPPLKDCPCCSERAQAQEIWAGVPMPTARIQCGSCGCMVEVKTDWVEMGMADALTRAIGLWNTRPVTAQPPEAAEAAALLDLIEEEALKSNAPLGRSDSLALQRIRAALAERRGIEKA